MTFEHFAMAVGLAWFGFAAYWCGRLHAQWERDQEPEARPAGWAVECGCGAERIRATPLTATPLADRLRDAEESARRGWEQADSLHLSVKEWRERAEKAEARVEELEAQAATDDAHALVVNDALHKMAALRGRAEKAERLADQLCAVLGREVGNRGDSEGAVDVAERLIRERDEAVAALRLAEDGCGCALNEEHQGPCEACAARRAVLAKYPEAKR